MSKIKLTGDTSGYIEISAPNVAANNTLELGGGTKILTNLDNVFTGVTTYSGNIDLNANLDLADNNKILIGTGDDLQIYHNGTNSYVLNNTTGDLRIEQAVDDRDIILQADNGSGGQANYLFCDGSSGRVVLSHYGSGKIETSSTGATVTGTLVSGSVTSELDLTAISSSISDTAVDVFVYDTRKDSDGGAWRKRTQHTSWYNETLNTSTRGSRKEFPAVAVIVALDNVLRIYDGDDPDLPMWMVFTSADASNYTGPHLNIASGSTLSAVAALNGEIVVTCNSGTYPFGSVQINFLKDRSLIRPDVGGKLSITSIAKRNVTGSYNVNYAYTALVNKFANDVAMTVLPNAPIDDATGLPVPTIAVGTADGVSIIKDDGNVIDYVHQNGTYDATSFIEFLGDNRVAYAWDNDTTPRRVFISPVRSNDTSTVDSLSYPRDIVDTVGYGRPTDNKGVGNYHGHLLGNDQSVAAGMNGSMLAVGDGSDGLNLVDVQAAGDDTFNSLVAFATTSYNTGWQYGNIKGAFLSDTDTTNAVAAYYDDFANNNNGWGFVNTSISGGNMVITQQSQARSTDPDALSHVSTGVKLVFTGTVSGSGTGTFIIDDDGAGAGQGTTTTYGSVSSTGSFSFTVTKTGSPRIRIMRTTGSNDYNINFLNISTEYDRSVNNKGLEVYGTVTKSAVATGADLVGYSGFSASNRLGNRGDYNFGVGNSLSMCIIGWFKTADISSYAYIMSVYDTGTDYVAGLAINGSASGGAHPPGTLYLYDSVTSQTSGTTLVNDGQWHCAVGIFDGPNRKIYLDGKLQVSNTYTSYNLDIADTDKLTVGRYAYNDSYHFLGSLALTRISKSIPSPEQVKKMYEDEKVLFQENAKATLYGSSDAVTALGYDEDTELLHVGTSAGRSDFQGLRRINNTTTAVTTAISASNELIAEQ